MGLQDVRVRDGGDDQEDVVGWRPTVLDGLGRMGERVRCWRDVLV